METQHQMPDSGISSGSQAVKSESSVNDTANLAWWSRPSTGWSFQAFHLLLLALTGVMALLFLIEAARSLPVKGDNMYPEAAGVLAAQRWAHGLPLYEDLPSDPCPDHALSAPLVWLIGGDSQAWPGRSG